MESSLFMTDSQVGGDSQVTYNYNYGNKRNESNQKQLSRQPTTVTEKKKMIIAA